MADLQSTQTEKDSFRCPICLERLTVPRNLPCLHTFCEVCIQTYISSTTTRDEDDLNVVDCPVCRQRVKEPRKDISSEDWAKSLPLNKWVLAMTIDPQNDSVKYCLFCKREDLMVLAKHWCKSCSEPICNDCKRFHKRVPSLKDHRIVELHNIEQLHEVIEIDENCAIHKGKVFELFCKNHNELCCGVCFANQHKRCADFDSIDDLVMKMNKDQMTDKLKSLSSLHDCITKLQDENKDQIDALCTSKEDICYSIAKKVEEAKLFLDQAHEQWGKYFEVEHAKQTNNIEMMSDELKRFDTTVTEAKAIFSSVLKSGSNRQIFVLHWKLHTQINDHFNRMKLLQIWHLTKSYSFKTNLLDNFTDAMKFENVLMSKTLSDALKRIYVSGKSLLENSLPSPKSWLANMNLMASTIRHESTFNLNSLTFFGIFIDDNNVVISNESNKSLEVYDISSEVGKLVFTYQCETIPYDLCHAYAMNRIYVAFGHFVVQYEIKNQGTEFIEVEKIQVEGIVQGLAKTIDGFFTADDSSTSFRWSDFSIKSNLPYVKSRDRPFICSSFCGTKVAYIRGRSVIVTTTDGKKLTEYLCTAENPGGLSFDSEDNIVVCSENELPEQIKADGQFRRNVDTNAQSTSKASKFSQINIISHPEGHKWMSFSNKLSSRLNIAQVFAVIEENTAI